MQSLSPIERHHATEDISSDVNTVGCHPVDRQTEIFYLCPDFEIQSAGIRRLYRHVDLLVQSGFNARILHLQSGFGLKDMPRVPVSYLDSQHIGSNAIIVIPEGCPTIMDALKNHPARRFVIALNWDYIFKGLPEGMDWRTFNIERVLAVSREIGRIVTWSMNLPIHILGSSIDHRLYYVDDKAKQPRIVFIARKTAQGAGHLKRLLGAREPEYIKSIQWRGLHGMPEADYAAQIREASIFLNLSTAEGFPTSCLEAMASGTLVAGYDSVGGRELLRGGGPDQNCILAPMGDYVSLAYALEPLLKALLQGQLIQWKPVVSNALKTVRGLTRENESQALITFWDGICSKQNDKPSAQQWFDRAVALQADGAPDRAMACYRQALQISPHMAEAHFNLGLIYCSQKAWPQSIVHFKKAWDLKPGYVDAAYNLAAALKEDGQYHKAIAIYRMTLDLAPKMADAHYHQGLCHLALGDSQRTVEAISQAVALDPQNSRYAFHLAQAHLSIGDMDAALACYRKVIELSPDWDAAHYNTAVALRMAERIEEAIRHAEQAIRINPEYTRAYPLLFRLAQHACQWDLADAISRQLDRITRMELDQGLKTTEPPLTSMRRQMDVQANMRVARSWSRDLVLPKRKDVPCPSFEYPAGAAGRVRVGYLSSDFKDHAVAYQVRGMIEKHDRNRFEIFGYACNADDGTAYRRRLAEACDHFHDVHALANSSVARQINNDGIHILVDMSGHSRDNRLGIAALRPAPVQVSYLGFLSTTGADFIDYVLADPIVVPEAHAAFYSEKIAYLPYCYQANDDGMSAAEQPCHRDQWHLPEQAFVYCSFNQPYKIDAGLFATWMKILKCVDHSVLWLVERSALARANLCRAAERAGIDPGRLIFTGFVPQAQNLARLQLADLVLDTLIYNGGATTSNALWAGVPVLSILGRHWVSRMSASALNAVGLPELIASDLDDYAAMAVDLARNPLKLETLRRHLLERRTTAPLFNTALFTRHVEKAYTHMWDRSCSGLPPATFHIDP